MVLIPCRACTQCALKRCCHTSIEFSNDAISYIVLLLVGRIKFVMYAVFRTHLQDLKDVTEEVHYENHRAQYIQNSDNNNIQKFPTKNTGENTDQLLNEKDEEVGIA